MRDNRRVDDLSIDELERVLAIRKRQARRDGLGRAEPKLALPDPALLRQEALAASTQRDTDSADAETDAAAIGAQIAALSAGMGDARSLFAPSGEIVAVETPAGATAIEARAPRGMVLDGRTTLTPRPALPQGEGEVAPPRRKPKRSRRIIDRVLLGVEIVAILGIVFVAVTFLQARGTLERETAVAQAEAEEIRRAGVPTLAPTPTLRMEDVVLPTGHVFVGGQPQFNVSEIPEHLRPMVQTQMLQPIINRPPPTTETALSIAIPRLNLNQSIVQGIDWEALKQGVGQLPNGINPGADAGNLVLAAHNDIYGELFRYLDQLEAGDEFTIETRSRLFTYRITETRVVQPNDVYVMAARDGATATLISCYPYQQNDQRIVVFADRIS